MKTYQLNSTEVWAEMARRKIQFHLNEKWDEIRLWGLFTYNSIRRFLKNGSLLTDMKPENKTVWVRPSKKAWETKIKPLLEKYSLDQLTKMAGWED